MYRVRNLLPGSLSLELENGSSISLQCGQSFDIESNCSRRWIKNDPTIARMIMSKYLELTHDSEAKVPGTPIKSVRKYVPEEVKAPKAKVEPVAILSYDEVPIPPKSNSVYVEDLTPPEPIEEPTVEELWKEDVKVAPVEKTVEKHDDLVAAFVEPMFPSAHFEKKEEKTEEKSKKHGKHNKKRLFGKKDEEIA